MELLIFYIKRQEEECCVLRVKSQTFDLTFFKVNVECVRQSGEHFTGGRAGGLSFLCVKNCVHSCFFFFSFFLFLLSFILAPVLDHSFGISSFVIIKLGQQNHTRAKKELKNELWKSFENEILAYFPGYV